MTIGLVGHRRNKLSEPELAELPRRLRALFDEIGLAAGSAPVALVTGMAEGTDLIGAATRPLAWSLVAILTEPPKSLADRMERADAAELLRLCAEPGVTLELLTGPFDDYYRQARAIISRSRLLVAVWDGQPGRGPGGTADSVSRAYAAHRPTVILPAAGGAPIWADRRRGVLVNAPAIAQVLLQS